LRRAKRELQLPFDAAEGIPAFDTSEHETYTEEEPNSLSGEETASFLACLKDEFPGQYAMAFLGFATGLRPSTLRPLRRAGPTPDLLWDQGVVLVRRSHSLGDEFMNTPEQKASELLFPAEDGGFRSVSFLKKAFATAGSLIGLKKSFTPRGMRRTFNDLMRLARVEAVVTKSISGHLTDRMREHYSTVTPDEQRRSIRNVVNLFGDRQSGEGSGEGTPASGEGQPKVGRH